MDEMEPVSRSEAVERLREPIEQAHEPGGATDRVELAHAGGRVLAEPVTAPADVPRYDRATMDGFAFDAADVYPLRVVDAVFPEDEPPDIGSGEAVEVATGAPLPKRANVVLKREDATVSDSQLSGPTLSSGTNCYQAGTTAAADERLFEAGQRLAPRHVSLLRDVGIDVVTACHRLSVAVLATGTEIHDGRQPDRDSEMLCSLLRRWGCDPSMVGTTPDDAAEIRAAIETAAADHDLVVTTGGTSVGRGDHVVNVLRTHDLVFRGVDLRPGRPATAATVDGTPVCALPGKPIAAHTAATLVVRPALTGDELLSTVSTEFAARLTLPGANREYAVPVTIDEAAMPLGHAESSLSLYGDRFRPGRVASSTRATLADGLVLTRSAIEAGEHVDVVPYGVIE